MDVYDELKTRRSYKKAVGVFDTLIIIIKKTNEQRIWPKLLNSFISLIGTSRPLILFSSLTIRSKFLQKVWKLFVIAVGIDIEVGISGAGIEREVDTV